MLPETLNAGQAWCNEWQTSVVRKKETMLRDEDDDDELKIMP